MPLLSLFRSTLSTRNRRCVPLMYDLRSALLTSEQEYVSWLQNVKKFVEA